MLDWLEDHPKAKLLSVAAAILAIVGTLISGTVRVWVWIDHQQEWAEEHDTALHDISGQVTVLHDMLLLEVERQTGWEKRESLEAAAADAERAEQLAQRESRFDQLELGQARIQKHLSDVRAETNRMLGEHLGEHQD